GGDSVLQGDDLDEEAMPNPAPSGRMRGPARPAQETPPPAPTPSNEDKPDGVSWSQASAGYFAKATVPAAAAEAVLGEGDSATGTAEAGMSLAVLLAVCGFVPVDRRRRLP